MDGSQSARLLEPVPRTSDGQALREALGAFATGVTVVTSEGDGGPCGVTANAFSSLSMVPPLVLVCLRSTSSAARTIERNRAFAVNVLSVAQEPLARRFSSPARLRGHTSFSRVQHRTEVTGAPILDGVVCWLDCALVAMPTAGDHVIVIGEILDFDSDRARDPLVFHAGRYRLVRDRAPAAAPSPLPLPLVTRNELNR
jgi:flavin reductase (DIM6/NTAB) family NADH-FMN oxidoreductase RutF